MNTPKPETVLPLLAVSAWKHRAFIAAQAAVVRLALEQPWFHPGEIPEDIVTEADRQGVVSNAWNMLRSAEIIERLPMNYTNEREGVFGGRTRNANPKAKGRWVACYRLRSRALAEAWLERNCLPIATERPMVAVQEEMAL